MSNNWKIRMLSRLLAGREVWLTEGRLSLGEQGCDICIPLTTNGNIVLYEQQGCLFVEAGKASIRLNGRRHRPDKPLPVSGVLEVAGIALAFGSKESQLAGYRIPVPWRQYGWLAGLLLLFTAGIGALLSAGKPPAAVDSLHQRVKSLLRQSDLFPDIHANWKPDGSLQLSGYCQASKQMQKVRVTLDGWGVVYRDEVICADRLASEVLDTLLQAGYHNAEVSWQGAGKVLIHADIHMDQQWSMAQTQLNDIPGLQHWQIDNPHQVQSEAIIAAMAQNALIGLVNVTPMHNAFVISGILDPPHQQRLQKAMAELQTRYPQLSLSYQPVAASHDGGKYLPAPVSAYVQGRRGNYLLLTNGERLRVGSRLPAGGKIVQLDAHVVAIAQQDGLINFPLDF